jgi:N-acetylgalactosamine kinase
VKLGRKGEIVRVGFFDFIIRDAVPFPTDHVMVICDSGIRAEKTGDARDQFNHRVSCYRIGLALIRRAFPRISPLLEHLRDLHPTGLGLPLRRIYQMLLRLPECATARELQEMLPEDDLGPLLATHCAPPDGLYPVRGVVLFGLAECERASRFAALLRAGRFGEIGEMMRTSHDGDRVARLRADGEEEPFLAPTSDGYLLRLIEDLESGDPARVLGAQIHRQPGSYRCSLAAIDRMVDISTRVPGVVGAQLAGAGLGGCMMVLARTDAVEALRATLTERYYEPAGGTPRLLVCRPIAGAGVLAKDRDR